MTLKRMFVVAAVVLEAAGEASAQSTTDGPCAVLREPGVTPALYGLCVAYVEAIDCPPMVDPTAPPATGKCKVASRKLLDRYNALKSPTDPPMPGVAPPPSCPCFTRDELSPLGFLYLDSETHAVFAWLWTSTYGVPANYMRELGFYSPRIMRRADAGVIEWNPGTAYDELTCYFFQQTVDFGSGTENYSVQRVLPVTPAEAAICSQDIADQYAKITAAGIPMTTCPSPYVGCP